VLVTGLDEQMHRDWRRSQRLHQQWKKYSQPRLFGLSADALQCMLAVKSINTIYLSSIFLGMFCLLHFTGTKSCWDDRNDSHIRPVYIRIVVTCLPLWCTSFHCCLHLCQNRQFLTISSNCSHITLLAVLLMQKSCQRLRAYLYCSQN